MPRQKASTDFTNHHMILGLDAVYSQPAKTFAASSPSEIHALLFCRRLQVLKALGQNSDRQRRTVRLDHVFMSRADFQMIGDVFEQWPEGLHEFFESHLNHGKECPSTYLLGTPLTGKTILPVVKSGARRWSFRHHALQKPGTKTPQLVQSSSQGTVGIKYLIESTGCSYDTARFWIESGRLGPCSITTQKDGTLRYQIDKSRVQKAIQISKSTASVSEMALALGTSNSVIRALVRTNVLHAVPYGKASYNLRVLPSEVFSFANDVLRQARRRRKLTNEQLMLTKAVNRFKKRPLGLLKAFFGALLNGGIALNKTEAHITRLDELLVDLESLLAWERVNLP